MIEKELQENIWPTSLSSLCLKNDLELGKESLMAIIYEDNIEQNQVILECSKSNH